MLLTIIRVISFLLTLHLGNLIYPIHAWIAARNECEQSGMRPVPDTLAVIAALIHSASYLLNSKLPQKFIPIATNNKGFSLARDMYVIVRVRQYINILYFK